MGYYEDLEIDEFNLIKEWQNQPKLYMQYAEEAVQLQQEVDNQKDAIEVLTSQIDLEIREGTYSRLPEKVKITEGFISSLVSTDPRVIALKEQYNQAKYEAVLAKKSENAFDQRKSALENLVKLTGREYYAEPVDKSENVNELKEKFVNDAMTEKLKRKIEKKD